MKKYVFSIILLLFCFVLIGCNNKTEGNKDTVEFVFSSNPTTGYNWGYENLTGEDYLKIEKDEYVADEVDEGIVGSGGKRYYSFKTVKAGTESIKFIYDRTFENEDNVIYAQYDIVVDENLKITSVSLVSSNYF